MRDFLTPISHFSNLFKYSSSFTSGDKNNWKEQKKVYKERWREMKHNAVTEQEKQDLKLVSSYNLFTSVSVLMLIVAV